MEAEGLSPVRVEVVSAVNSTDNVLGKFCCLVVHRDSDIGFCVEIQLHEHVRTHGLTNISPLGSAEHRLFLQVREGLGEEVLDEVEGLLGG